MMAAFLSFATFFTACSSDAKVEVAQEITPETTTLATEPTALSVADMREAEDDAAYYNILFFESPAIYRIPKAAIAAIQTLKDAQTNKTPVVLEIAVTEEHLIKSVTPASGEPLRLHKQLLQNTIAPVSSESLLSAEVESRSNDIIPNTSVLNEIFRALRSMSVMTTSGNVINSTLNIPGYSLGRIPFQYAKDGCYARAHAMRRVIEYNFGYTSYKRFIQSTHANVLLTVKATNWGNPGCCITWGFHVAPLVRVRMSDGSLRLYVLDPSIFSAPVPMEVWDNSMIGNSSTACRNNSAYSNYYKRYVTISDAYTFSPTGTSFVTDNYYTQTNSTLRNYRYERSCR